MENPQEYDGPRLLVQADLPGSHQLVATSFGGVPETLDDGMPRTGKTYLIAHHGTPVSQISIFQEQVLGFDFTLRVGSIGGVCTLPEYRGQGLATRLLDFCARRLAEGGARLMLISGGRGLYTRTGNIFGGRFAGFILEPGMLRPPSGRARLRPACAEDAQLCSRIYQAEPFHFERKIGLYEEHLRERETRYHAEKWIVEWDGRPAAYLLLNTPWEYIGRPDARVREIYEYAGSRSALAEGLCLAMQECAFQQLYFAAPWQDEELIRMASEAGGRWEWAPLPEHTMRVINFHGLMADLLAYTQARLTPSLRRGLRFEQAGPLLGGSGSDVFRILRGADRLRLDGAALTGLVMGSGEPPPPAPGALKEILAALFPLPSFLPGINYH